MGLSGGEGVLVNFWARLKWDPPSAEIAAHTSNELSAYCERHTAPSTPVLENAIHGLTNAPLTSGSLIATGPVQVRPESLVVYTSTSVATAMMFVSASTAYCPGCAGSAASVPDAGATRWSQCAPPSVLVSNMALEPL